MTMHHITLSEWAAAVVALFAPSPLGALKKGNPMNLIKAIKATLPAIALFITLAEDALGDGAGAEKKARAIADVKGQLPAIAADLGIPGFVVTLLLNDAVLDVVIDLMVSSANACGAFNKAVPATPTKALSS